MRSDAANRFAGLRIERAGTEHLRTACERNPNQNKKRNESCKKTSACKTAKPIVVIHG
jgi:hypothetical protein